MALGTMLELSAGEMCVFEVCRSSGKPLSESGRAKIHGAPTASNEGRVTFLRAKSTGTTVRVEIRVSRLSDLDKPWCDYNCWWQNREGSHG